MSTEFRHKPVLLNECIEGLKIRCDGTYVDGTLGGAGHSSEILKKIGAGGRLIGIDQDADAIAAATQRLEAVETEGTFSVVKSNFVNMKQACEECGVSSVDGILLDLGVSSYQLDNGDRGFSYRFDAPLDMRMDRDAKLSAYDVVNTYSVQKLTEIIKDYGEERYAGAIARRIERAREKAPVRTTFELVDIIKSVIPAAAGRHEGHPAKRTFQAIRIEVNQELEVLKGVIDRAVDLLNPGGRLCIITFHSLEDRIVKQAFKRIENPCTCPKDFPVCVCGKQPKGHVVTNKPILPTKEETKENTRAESAKLRIYER